LDVVLPLRTKGTANPLFCVHPALGISWCYAGLLRHVSASRPIYGLQARAILRPESTPETIDNMVDDYVEQILEIQPAGPYYLLGWSFGGLVAQAIAVRLQRLGHQISFLALLDSFPFPQSEDCLLDNQNNVFPVYQENRRAINKHDKLIQIIEALSSSKLDDSLKILNICDILSILHHGGRLLEIDEFIVENLLNIWETNERFIINYVPQQYRGNMLLLVATRENLMQPKHRWTPFIAGAVEVRSIDCAHTEMMDQSPLAQIGAVIAPELDSR
jgi:nonribosomal peptide synthetase DhbF